MKKWFKKTSCAAFTILLFGGETLASPDTGDSPVTESHASFRSESIPFYLDHAEPQTDQIPVGMNFTEYNVSQIVARVKVGNYTLSNPKEVRAFGQAYGPAIDELSVKDLVFKYHMTGHYTEFWKAIEKLSHAGNPNAWDFWGHELFVSNYIKKNDAYYHGIALLMMASEAGSLDACYWLATCLYNWENQKDLALEYYKKGIDFPFCAGNYGSILVGRGKKIEGAALMHEGAEGGDPETASLLSEFYAEDGSKIETIKWGILSYHGFACMDRFWGLLKLHNFLTNDKFTHHDKSEGQRLARQWMKHHHMNLMDGYDQFMFGTKPLYTIEERQVPVDRTSVQALFWTTYAVGDRNTFVYELRHFKEKDDANAFCMIAHAYRGFGLEPDEECRRVFLEKAVKKLHPMASMELAIDLMVEAALSDSTKAPPLYQRAYETLFVAYGKWASTHHKDAIADLTFLLGYFVEHGIGTQADKDAAQKYYDEVRFTSIWAEGYLASHEADLVERLAQAQAVYPSFTLGDCFNGFFTARQTGKLLNPQQLADGFKKSVEIVKAHPRMAFNIYQLMAEGLDEAFSGKE
jgi:TPR repeat protein